MANSFTQIYIQYVFTVKGKQNLIPEKHNQDLQKYIRGIAEKRDAIVVAINNTTDHMHILVSLNPKYSISKLIQEIKSSSSKYINEKKWVKGKFQWQNGYGVFSYSKSHIKDVIKYIERQQHHHQNRSFREEYIAILEKYQIEYNDKNLFEFYA